MRYESPQEYCAKGTKQAREFHPPEAKYDWARGGCAGAKSSRAPTGVGTGPDKVGVNASKQAREFHRPEAINDWARGGIANRLVGPA